MGDHVCLLPLCTRPVHESRSVNRAYVSPEKLKKALWGWGTRGLRRAVWFGVKQ